MVLTPLFINPKLSQTFLNSALVKNAASGGTKAYVNHFGLGGRLDGPVDNPVSSCISCHARAANLPDGKAAALGNFNTTIANYPLTDFNTYFREVPGGTGKLVQVGQSFTQADYSLQLVYGIRNYYQHQILVSNSTMHHMNHVNGKKEKPAKSLPLVTRGGN